MEDSSCHRPRGYCDWWLEGLGQLKNPMTSPGIEPATFRLVAQCPESVLQQTKKKFLIAGGKNMHFHVFLMEISRKSLDPKVM
jgi:hypothetical protein